MRILISPLALILMIVGTATFGVGARETAADKKSCCFSNPRYSGQCKVTPGPEESCSQILTYLNAQNSVGKAYCGNTTIRGGWTTVTCEETKHAIISPEELSACNQQIKTDNPDSHPRSLDKH